MSATGMVAPGCGMPVLLTTGQAPEPCTRLLAPSSPPLAPLHSLPLRLKCPLLPAPHFPSSFLCPPLRYRTLSCYLPAPLGGIFHTLMMAVFSTSPLEHVISSRTEVDSFSPFCSRDLAQNLVQSRNSKFVE